MSRAMRQPVWARLGLAVALSLVPLAAVQAMEKARPRIVAVGDVHGSPAAFSRLLRAAALVNQDGDWIGGNAILVQTGDLTDRGPGVLEVLDLIRDLERNAAESGGRVVALLGNHEVFNLIGWYDYQSTPLPVFTEIAAAFANGESEKTRKQAYKQWLSWGKKYPLCAPLNKRQWMARSPLGFVEYQEAMSPRGEVGRWLRDRKVVVNLQDTLFLHGGLSPELLDMGLTSLTSINETAATELEQFDRDRELLVNEGVIPPRATLTETHCAIAEELKELAEDLDEVAGRRREQLEDVRARLPGGEEWLLLDPRGPVWFRGYAKWSNEEAEAGLSTVFGTFGGSRVVVGHTPQPGAIKPRFDERVFLIDTAMAYPELNGGPVALEISGGVISAINESGRTTLSGEDPAKLDDSSVEQATPGSNAAGSLSALDNRGGPEEAGISESRALGPIGGQADVDSGPSNGTDGQPQEPAGTNETLASPAANVYLGLDGRPLPFTDEAAILEFLRDARVVEKRKIGKGITEAQLLLLEKDGLQARAAFHDVDVTKTRHRSRSVGPIMNFRDSYLNNVAAYELARLMGLTNVAPTTIRKLGRTRGSVQLWIEKTIDESERRERGVRGEMSVRLRRRLGDMWVFDNLIFNIDRNQGNMLHDSRGELWMIDHTRSFNAAKRLSNTEKMKRCSRRMLAAIQNLDEGEARERLRPYLSNLEIKALFARREKLLEFLGERIAVRGEDNFLFSYGEGDESITVYYEDDDLPLSSHDT